MRSIYYASNMHSRLFPENSRSKFETFTNQTDLDYIALGDIEVAIKSITFDNSRESPLDGAQILALKTNLVPDSISSYGWSNITSIFTVYEEGVSFYEFENPTFYPTSLKLLSTARFEIVNIATGEADNFGVGSPTFIEVVVRNQARRMKPPFQVLLDSSCETSKAAFVKNTNMEFTIQLPHRMEFQKDWILCLKSIHLSNKFKTTKDCSMKVMITHGTAIQQFKVEFDEYIPNLETLVEKINRKMRKYLWLTIDNGSVMMMAGPAITKRLGRRNKRDANFMPPSIPSVYHPPPKIPKHLKDHEEVNESENTLSDDIDSEMMKKLFGSIDPKFQREVEGEMEENSENEEIELPKRKLGKTVFASPNKNSDERSVPLELPLPLPLKRMTNSIKSPPSITVEMSKNLLYILGFQPDQTVETFSNSSKVLESTFTPNIYALQPSHFIVCCDIVGDSILGGQHVQVLKYFPNTVKDKSLKIVDVDFKNNDFVKLEQKHFDRIQIRIADITGATMECKDDIPTRLQLLFVNTNSQ